MAAPLVASRRLWSVSGCGSWSGRGPLERVDVDSFTCPMPPACSCYSFSSCYISFFSFGNAALLCTSIVVWHFVLFLALFAQLSLSHLSRQSQWRLPLSASSSRLRLGKYNLIFILMISHNATRLSWILFALGVCASTWRCQKAAAISCCSWAVPLPKSTTAQGESASARERKIHNWVTSLVNDCLDASFCYVAMTR